MERKSESEPERELPPELESRTEHLEESLGRKLEPERQQTPELASTPGTEGRALAERATAQFVSFKATNEMPAAEQLPPDTAEHADVLKVDQSVSVWPEW